MGNILKKKELIKVIEQALESGELAIFAGAGLSIDAGYCSWQDLLSEAAKEIDLDIERESHDLISLAQFYCNVKKRNAIDELLTTKFPTNVKPTENHKLLSQLPISTYWTTNYDTLIEDALKNNNKKVSVRKSDKDLQLSFKNYDSIVYKMHGDIHSPAKAVITKDDYEEYGINSRKLFRDVLEGNLLTKTFLFLGFSFSDPNFNFVISKMRVLLGDSSRAHYCILKKISKPNRDDYSEQEKYKIAIRDYEYSLIKQDLQINDLNRYGIKVYLIDNYSEITDILRTLLNKYRRKTVFISGSAEKYIPMDEKKAQDFIRKLSFELVKNGYKIVNGYGLGVGTYVINGITEYCYDHREIDIENRLKLMPFPLSAIDNKDLKDTWEKYRKEMISKCGIAIYIFGNKKKNGKILNADGVEKEYAIAESYEIVNIPLAFTGYMAEELYFKNSDKINSVIGKEKTKYITEFFDGDTNVEEIIKIINKLNNKEEIN